MATPIAESGKLSKLRIDAESRLKAGMAPPNNGYAIGVNTLALLHTMASTPANAVDALKLLHELQVHQVELDLQHEHIEATQRELAEDLARYQGLYESAPMPYLNVSAQLEILECNVAGAGLLGEAQDELRGRDIERFLLPASRPVLLALLKRLRKDGTVDRCEVQICIANRSRKLQVAACVTPGGRSYLLALLEFDRTQVA